MLPRENSCPIYWPSGYAVMGNHNMIIYTYQRACAEPMLTHPVLVQDILKHDCATSCEKGCFLSLYFSPWQPKSQSVSKQKVLYQPWAISMGKSYPNFSLLFGLNNAEVWIIGLLVVQNQERQLITGGEGKKAHLFVRQVLPCSGSKSQKPSG